MVYMENASIIDFFFDYGGSSSYEEREANYNYIS